MCVSLPFHRIPVRTYPHFGVRICRSTKALGDLRTAVVTKLAEASAAAAAHAQALDERVERNRKAAEEAVAQVGVEGARQ